MNSDFDFDNDRTLQHLTPGSQIFSRYTLQRLLGNGRKGDVWHARDTKLEGLDVALKVLRDYPRFAELQAQSGQLMNLSHHAIIRFIDIVGDSRLGGFVMEYFESRPLSGLLMERDGRPFEVSEIRRWARDLFSALAYAHEKLGVLHRDIRLANLLVDQNGVMKVSEFGLAPAEASLEDAEFQYLPALSPQVLVGEEHTVQDDLYAAAAAVYELLTGKPVFASGNIQLQIQRKIPPTLAARRAELQVKGDSIPKDWEEWIARCLEKDREARPASAREVLEILEAGAPAPKSGGTSRRAALANVGGAMGSAVGSLREKDFSWAAGLIKGAAALALLGGAVWWFWLKPLEEELIVRRGVMAELETLEAKSQEELAAANKSAADINALQAGKDTAQKAARRWLQFVEDYESDGLSFTSEDDNMLRDARRRQRIWEDEAESLSNNIARITETLAKAYEELETAFNLEKDADAALEKKSLSEQTSDARDRLDAWERFLREYSGGISEKSAGADVLLAQARQASDKWKSLIERQKKETEDWIALWEKNVQGVEANFLQSEKTKAEKLEQVRSILQKFATEKVPLSAAGKQTEFSTRLKKLESEALAMADPVPVDLGPFPKTVVELFKHTPLADKPEAQLKQALKKIQQQFKDEKLYTSTIDGTPGPALEAALKAWQEKQKLPVTGHLDAATWTTTRIGMMKPEDLIKELETPAAMVTEESGGSRTQGSSSKSKRSPRGRDYTNNPPSRGYYSSITMGKIRLLKDTIGGKLNEPGGKLKPEAAKNPQKVRDWNYHLSTWVDYCQWCERQ